MRGFLSKLKVRFLGLKRWQQIVVVVGVLLLMFAPVGASQEGLSAILIMFTCL